VEVPNLRRVSILLLVLALALVVAGVPAAPATPRSRETATAVLHRVRDAERSTDYWTKKRMRNAQPAPLPRAGQQGSTRSLSAESGGGPYPFTRTEVADPSAASVRMHGKVFFSDPSDGNDYVCSGTAVTSPNESVVWTAGHCVYLFAWHTNFIFVPGFRNGSTPFGEWPALYTSASTSWVSNNNVRQDIGVAVVDVDATGATLTDTVGSRALAFNGDRDQAYDSYGYPANPQDDPDFTGGREFVCTVDSAADDPFDKGSGPIPLAIGCDMTGGSSGGAWVGTDGRVYSVNSHGHPQAETDVMDGPYQGAVAQDLYNTAADITVHPMSLGIRLRRHLIVSGTLTADDGFTACAVGARIEVWRKGRRGWSLLKSERTNSAGKYSIKVKDRSGRYQAVAPEGPADDLNYCGLAFSRVLRYKS
jgi:hypothetical protein